MRNEHYEFIPTTFAGLTCFQIKALNDIAEFDVLAGNFGGYLVEPETMPGHGGTWLAAGAFAAEGVRIGARSCVDSNCWLSRGSEVSARCWINERSVLGRGCVRLASGSVVGDVS